MPTWVTVDCRASDEKNTRSPRWRRRVASPNSDWLIARRGRSTPKREYTYCVRPEQSNVFGPSAPHSYGRPIRLAARSTASEAAASLVTRTSDTKSAHEVLGT